MGDETTATFGAETYALPAAFFAVPFLRRLLCETLDPISRAMARRTCRAWNAGIAADARGAGCARRLWVDPADFAVGCAGLTPDGVARAADELRCGPPDLGPALSGDASPARWALLGLCLVEAARRGVAAPWAAAAERGWLASPMLGAAEAELEWGGAPLVAAKGLFAARLRGHAALGALIAREFVDELRRLDEAAEADAVSWAGWELGLAADWHVARESWAVLLETAPLWRSGAAWQRETESWEDAASPDWFHARRFAALRIAARRGYLEPLELAAGKADAAVARDADGDGAQSLLMGLRSVVLADGIAGGQAAVWRWALARSDGGAYDLLPACLTAVGLGDLEAAEACWGRVVWEARWPEVPPVAAATLALVAAARHGRAAAARWCLAKGARPSPDALLFAALDGVGDVLAVCLAAVQGARRLELYESLPHDDADIYDLLEGRW